MDLPKLNLLHKTCKAARLVMADSVVLNRTGIQYNGRGACVLSIKDVEDRRQLAENEKKDQEAKTSAQKEKQDNPYFLQASKDFMRLGPDLIYGPNPSVSLKIPKTPVHQLGIKNGEI